MKSAARPKLFKEVDTLSITVVTDNYSDALRPDAAIGRRYRSGAGPCVHAEHGSSYFIRCSAGGRRGAFMFDYGVDAGGVLNNIRILNIDVGKHKRTWIEPRSL